jgi:hypothetical protein
MTTPAILSGRAAEMASSNPANPVEKTTAKRVPMSLPSLKLEVPEIPGYVCYWFRGTTQRLQQAQRAGYEYVEAGEIELNSVGMANDSLGDGNTDMGTRVSVSAGGGDVEGSQGVAQGVRLYLMKIKKELWDADQVAIDERHEQIAAQLRGDKGFAERGADTQNRYSRGENRNMFQPRRAT